MIKTIMNMIGAYYNYDSVLDVVTIMEKLKKYDYFFIKSDST